MPRRLVVPALLVVAFLAAAWFARRAEGARALDASLAAFKRGDRVDAIVQARLAAQARCPGCSAPGAGLDHLRAIARDAEARADDATAVAAWRAARTAMLSTVVFDRASSDRTEADTQIARLEHRLAAGTAAAPVSPSSSAAPGAGGILAPTPAAGGTPPAAAAAEDRLRASLAASDVPSATVFVFLALGGLLFLASAVAYARSPTPRHLALAALGIALAAAGALLF